jgi:hypothetical protein
MRPKTSGLQDPLWYKQAISAVNVGLQYATACPA